MNDDPLDRLAADARERPLLYAGVAVAGLAGIATAVALSSRVAPAVRASGARSLLHAARSVIGEKGERASGTPEDATERLRDLVERLGDAFGTDPDAAPAGRDRGTRGDTERDDADRDGAGRREEAGVGGIGGSTAAVFLGTLLSKAFTGWMRLQAEQRARAQGVAMAGGGAPYRGPDRSDDSRTVDDGFDLEAHLTSLNVADLRTLASEHEIEGRSSMNKDELVEALCGRI